MGFGSTRKFSSDQLPNSPTAPVQGTELDGRLQKGSPALTESGWWPPQGPLCQAAREAGRGAGAGSAHTQRPHDTRPPAAGGGGRAARSRSADVKCPQTYSQEPCAWADDSPGPSRSRPGS